MIIYIFRTQFDGTPLLHTTRDEPTRDDPTRHQAGGTRTNTSTFCVSHSTRVRNAGNHFFVSNTLPGRRESVREEDMITRVSRTLHSNLKYKTRYSHENATLLAARPGMTLIVLLLGALAGRTKQTKILLGHWMFLNVARSDLKKYLIRLFDHFIFT